MRWNRARPAEWHISRVVMAVLLLIVLYLIADHLYSVWIK